MKFCTRVILLLSLTLSLVAVGCDKKDAQEPAKAEAAVENAEQAQPEAEPAEKAEKPAEQPEKLAMVDVPAAGKKFDPPVQREQMPEGAWHCDMGTVHWASMEKPEDGRCPECNMELKQYDADKLAEQDGEHGHAH